MENMNILNNLDWVLGIRSDFLTPIFMGLSLLGYSGFFFMFIPIGYWVIDKKLFTRVGVLLVLSGLLNLYLKDFFPNIKNTFSRISIIITFAISRETGSKHSIWQAHFTK